MKEHLFLGAIERIYRRVLLIVGRGRVRLVNDGGNVQTLQVRLGQDELRDGTPRLAEYGFTSHPPLDSDVVVVFVGGDRSNAVAIASNHQASRLKGLQSGEVAIFDNQGQSIYLTRAGIVINGAGLALTVNNTPTVTVNADSMVQLNTPQLHVSGQIVCGATITASGDISDNADNGGSTMSLMRSTYNSHTHKVTDVQTGSSTVTSNTPTQKE